MFAHEFVRNAYLAGTFIALACGCVGWFVVLRGQLFAGDALSHVAFVGAIARRGRRASTSGVGLFALTLARRGRDGRARPTRRSADDAVIGTVFAWILGIGVLLITLLATSDRRRRWDHDRPTPCSARSTRSSAGALGWRR